MRCGHILPATVIQMKTKAIRTYSKLQLLSNFRDRYDYLRIGGAVGKETFGYDRYLNQALYTSSRWRKTRQYIIIRDNGCDLGIDGFYIQDMILVHHMNPLSIRDVEEERDEIFDPEFLICVSRQTHNAIHYGDEAQLPQFTFIERCKFDTCPWKAR